MEKRKQTDTEQRKVLDGFMSWMTCDRDYSENTVRSFMYAAADFFQHFDEFNAVNCRKYVSMLMRSGRRASTVNSRISGLSALSRYLKVPVCIKHIKTPRKLYLDNVMSELEYNRLVNFLAGYHRKEYYFYVRILASTGARISEFLQMTWEDVIRGQVVLVGKGNKERLLFFPSSLQRDARVFVESCHLRGRIAPVTDKSVRQAIRRMAVKAGVPAEKVHPHAFRHFFAKMFLKRSNDITMLADLLGHASLNTTRIYLQKSYDEQQREFNQSVNW